MCIILQASLVDQRHRDNVYLAIVGRALACTDQCDARCCTMIRSTAAAPVTYVSNHLLFLDR